MGRIVISEWMSLDGVFDATLMARRDHPGRQPTGRAAAHDHDIPDQFDHLPARSLTAILAPPGKKKKGPPGGRPFLQETSGLIPEV